MTYERLAKAALKLSTEARAKLARELLGSLEPLSDAEIDRLWLDEAERRDSELDAGKCGIPIQQVLKSARASHRSRVRPAALGASDERDQAR